MAKLQEIATQFVEEEEISAKDIEGYDDLTPAQQADLMEAIAETYDETKLIPHEEALKRLGQAVSETGFNFFEKN